ncbi:hypothetical protein AV645_06105 [Acinetobacter calcoaceticus]|nr:hypothetical protein AV645_06105 [Acinetobacter calcoaceticus]
MPDFYKDIIPTKCAEGILFGVDFAEFRSQVLFRGVTREKYESNQEKNIWIVFFIDMNYCRSKNGLMKFIVHGKTLSY